MKWRILLLLPFLLLPLLYVNPVEGQSTPHYYLSVETDAPYKLRGETINIITRTNASSFIQQIYDPDGVLIYNKTRTSNMTFTVPDNAPYGTYTIKSIVGNRCATTWLTVLDASGWETASLPYSRVHKNLNYTFYGLSLIHI